MDGLDYINAIKAEIDRWNRAAETLSKTIQRTHDALEPQLRNSHKILIAENALTTMRALNFLMVVMSSILDEFTALRLEQRPEKSED